MAGTKRVSLSLRVSEHARDALRDRAAREGHRYPLALAATLLEEAVVSPATAGTSRGEWLSDVGALARAFGGSVAVAGDRVTLALESTTRAEAIEWLRVRFLANRPPPAGVSLEVKVSS